MAKIKWKKAILQVVGPPLEAAGYSFLGSKDMRGQFRGTDTFYFGKVLREEDNHWAYFCFQLSQHALPPYSKREFIVSLHRNKSKGTVTAPPCEPLGTRFPALLQFHFNVPIYLDGCGWWDKPPTEKESQRIPVYLSEGRWWQFETQQELEEQLAVVLDNLLKYGIPWLEDPESRLPPWGYFGPPPPGQEWAEA